MNSKQRRDGKPIETLGVYKPRIDPARGEHAKTVEWSVARIKYWLGVGAIPSESAVRLFTQVRTRKPFRYALSLIHKSLAGRNPTPQFQISPADAGLTLSWFIFISKGVDSLDTERGQV